MTYKEIKQRLQVYAASLFSMSVLIHRPRRSYAGPNQSLKRRQLDASPGSYQTEYGVLPTTR